MARRAFDLRHDPWKANNCRSIWYAEDAIGVGRRAPKTIEPIVSVGQQAAEFSEEMERMDGREAIASRQRCDLRAMGNREGNLTGSIFGPQCIVSILFRGIDHARTLPQLYYSRML
jgi:hypothetical protein